MTFLSNYISRRRVQFAHDFRGAVPRKTPKGSVHQRGVPPERVHRWHVVYGHHSRPVESDSQRVYVVDVDSVAVNGSEPRLTGEPGSREPVHLGRAGVQQEGQEIGAENSRGVIGGGCMGCREVVT